MVDKKQLKVRFVKQILAKIEDQLVHSPEGSSTYQLSYGDYEMSNFKGKLLIEFDRSIPVAGVYYGFQIYKQDSDIEEVDIDNIDKMFAPIIKYLEFVLQKTIYHEDDFHGKYYWAFWLRCNDYDIESAKKHMEVIQDYFNQIVISKYPIQKNDTF